MRFIAGLRRDAAYAALPASRAFTEIIFSIVAFAAIAYALIAERPSRAAPQHQLTQADLKLQSLVWSPVGIRTRWCERQDACRNQIHPEDQTP